jgi:hypothetical protein
LNIAADKKRCDAADLDIVNIGGEANHGVGVATSRSWLIGGSFQGNGLFLCGCYLLAHEMENTDRWTCDTLWDGNLPRPDREYCRFSA